MLSESSRTFLLAGVSIAALMAISGHAKAADMPTKAPPVARESVKDAWAWWVEGGALRIGGERIGFGQIDSVDPKWGAEGAIGFDWKSQALSSWHLSGQFRYGQSQRSHRFNQPTVGFVPTFNPGTVAAIGTEQLKELHWLLDFAVGRDFALGSSQGQLKFGIRIADLSARLSGTFLVTTFSSIFPFEQSSRFIGAGPRIGVEGSTPLGGPWSLDWLAGAALLVGKRTLDISLTDISTTVVINTGLSRSSTAAVPNIDAALGLSYWLNPALKVTASYRFDGYFGALSSFNGNGALVNVNRFYHGPMLRLTYATSAPSVAGPRGSAAAPTHNWTGFYLGPQVGCGWSGFSLSPSLSVDAASEFTGLQSNGSGCFVGGQLGYNYQLANNFVAGIEADAALAQITGQGALREGVAVTVYRQKIKDFGTVRGRLGYAYGQALPYLTGGWAWARNSLNIVEDAGANTTDTKMPSGWTLGGGLEYTITPKWSVKGEYLYADLGGRRYTVLADSDGPPQANLDIKLHTFKLGANYHW